MSKVLWEHHSIKKFLDAKKKIFSYGSGVKKASKSKFALVRLKTYLNEIIQNLQFLWVKTVMGVERFVVHFLTFFLIDQKCNQIGKKIANASHDDFYMRIFVKIFSEGRRQDFLMLERLLVHFLTLFFDR